MRYVNAQTIWGEARIVSHTFAGGAEREGRRRDGAEKGKESGWRPGHATWGSWRTGAKGGGAGRIDYVPI